MATKGRTRGRKVKVRLGIAALLFLSIMVTFHSCVTFRMSPSEINAYFKQHQVSASQAYYKQGYRKIHYVETSNQADAVVIFVHGSPGSLDAFIHFLTDSALLQRAVLVSVDRPGFGQSNFGVAEPSLLRQGELLKPLLARYKEEKKSVFLVGHSLGGPLIARMAMDHPDLVDGLVLVAPSIDPDLEPNETWFRAPLSSPFLSWILPHSLRASNDEIYHLKYELEVMMDRWKELQCPVVVIQGTKDSLVDPGNADFAQAVIQNAPLEIDLIDGMDHFVPWSHPHLIRHAVIELIEREIQPGIISGN